MIDRGLFEPDVLIADQVGARRRGAALSSEKRLMLAVLENALDQYQRYISCGDPAGRQLFQEAAEWIESTSHESLYSFERISEVLDINSEYLRRGLAAWRRRLIEANQAVDVCAPESPQRLRFAR